jgi:formylglycine-generating enzyme required for sulfatase activity
LAEETAPVTEVPSVDQVQTTESVAAPSPEEKPVAKPGASWLPPKPILYAGAGLFVGLIIVIVGIMPGVDKPSESPVQETAVTDKTPDLLALQTRIVKQASQFMDRRTEVLAESRDTNEKLAEIETLFVNAGSDEKAVLHEQRNQLVEDNRRLLEKATLIQTQVGKNLDVDEIDRVSAMTIKETLSEGEISNLESHLNSIQARLDAAESSYAQMEQAISARENYLLSISRWQTYGLSWPATEEDLVKIDEISERDGPIDDPSSRADNLLATGQFSEAEALWRSSGSVLGRMLEQMAAIESMRTTRITTLLTEAELAITGRNLTTPGNANAFACYQQVLEMEPGNQAALKGLGQIIVVYIRLMDAALRIGNTDRAQSFEQAAREVSTYGGGVELARVDAMSPHIQRYIERRKRTAISSATDAAIAASDYDRLLELQVEAEEFEPGGAESNRIASAITRIETKPGRVFTDDLMDGQQVGPQLVVLPRGRFTMGAGGRKQVLVTSRNATPAHEVVVNRPLAMALTEVSVAEFRQFINATGYQTDAERLRVAVVLTGKGVEHLGDRTWQQDYLGRDATDELPVVHVSWNDAAAYVAWLSESTGQRYRMPSESEFEYAARAGATGRFPWREGSLPNGIANLNGQQDMPPSTWGERPPILGDLRRYRDGFFGPAPGASFQANKFGLHDMIGNLSEWTGDCYVENFEGKGTSQDLRDAENCRNRVVRGSDWAGEPMRLSHRRGVSATTASNRIGFRVARELIGD